ncbi:hypothetical protein POL68_26130 [Stigmatella sp. ncwal1]|uniref:Beta-propeller repeat-containing protein n=1 Tax=Stigmatella ashevillensis TaxID=2995309 RepID=A0ABT5DFS5_9BACT|nr:hypothetical protein [Stigmatella ashevillena]MDC0711973.1 hypothetical protein [Stigmatella ashevillena]
MTMQGWSGRGLCVLGAVWGLGACAESASEELEGPLARMEQASLLPGPLARWARQSHGAENEASQAVAVDRSGNIVMAGHYTGATANVGGAVFPPPLGPQGTRAFLARYAPDGTHRGSQSYGHTSRPPGVSSLSTQFSDVAVDLSGRITVLGLGSLGTDVGGGGMPAGSFLVHYGANGEYQWARPLKGTLTPGSSITVDVEGNILLAGSFSGSVDLGVGSARTSPTQASFIAKYAPDGRWLWDRVFAQAHASHFGDVTTDNQGNVYVSGFFTQTGPFGGEVLSRPPGQTGPVIARYTAAGEHVWSESLRELDGGAEFRGIAVQGARLLVTGGFSGSFSFGRDTLSSLGGQQGLLLAYHRDGGELWAKQLGSSGWDVQIDPRDDAMVVGFAEPGNDLGMGPLPPESSRYLFLTKVDRAQGNQRWVSTFDAEGIVQVNKLAASQEGESIVSGTLSGPADFGTGLLTPDKTAAFLFRLRQ